MSGPLIGALGLVGVLLLIAIRIPIGVALGVAAVAGLSILRNLNVAMNVMEQTPFEVAASWSLSAIPMFILMGAIAHNSGISVALFRAARLWASRLPGGLAVATNLASAGFAAASGSSVATAATMGKLAIPEMLRNGYDKGLAAGVVASAGTLGALIPPSIMFVIYGVFAEVSITKLLIAGVLPGLLTAAVYTTMIILRAKLDPKIAPPVTIDAEVEGTIWRARWASLIPVWPVLVLIFGIIGGLYGGIFTPTEAGAGGALLACAIALVQGRLTRHVLWESVTEAVMTTASLLFVAYGAVMFTKFLALSGLPVYLGSMIQAMELSPYMLILAASVIYLILGMFLDPMGVLLLSLPVMQPMFAAVGADPIWVGVIVVKFIEIGLLTPPVGFNVYVVKSVVGDDIPIGTIFRGVGWFLICEAVIMFLLVVFPQISLYLPNHM
ncbi:MAG: TRAP transporter large permease subunit [Alphaproteobacteria bacterium]|jgi:C4-dicarboxylate transporter DctM subunit|uniref:TRAP transporter large permease protein n=1 Tax=Celeribacter baekdonensis TaxID=875171 RepID=A0A1G7P527_9RHOB|nr:TRAP transporter large permease subunit [Celeribacter baekdonensis]MBU0642297.1 TRAP transporter large permease subunit [Alphaproteobacteria bacterium]MBU1281129.1 TRAP transporter large permease subunit [Alphaproteobacteria bacterium]MBU1573671.1 TRAP transporter large permease subunit [Alphaproteobacteria bacterium]MBU1827750.1 TRAP transporter large permease subunit [Alphaproteobacteria bacterium]MBU2079427.1 TRAP transporter large permease subunit [Alphaproteobacteria bacterium]